jgi:monoamine oxidase
VAGLAVGIYDDGRAAVPGGVTGPVERVAIVGAGIAGLTVANALTHAGVDCVVLEARDRTGGRLHTVDLAGAPVDMGGSWIHHPAGNPLRAFADQVGVVCRPGNPLAGLAGYDCGERRRLSPSEVEESLALQFDAFPDAVARLGTDLGPDASAGDAIDAFMAGADLAPGPARRARQALRAVVEADAADLPENQSLRWLWNEIEYGGDYFGDLPRAGYRGVVDAMAGGLDVRLGVEVDEVALSAAGVRVRSTDGQAADASHVVVTVPLGVLKRGVPRFAPDLPADRWAAVKRLGFGRYEKVVLRFDRSFWRAAGLSHLMLFPRDPDASAIWVIDQEAFGAGATLVFHVFHAAAGHLLAATDDAAARWALGKLAEAVGGECPAPSAVAVTRWADDPYSGGAYSHVPPGADPADLDLLGEPIGGRLLFAGEHTQSARTGFADGALTSGIREAKRLLGRQSVALRGSTAGAR